MLVSNHLHSVNSFFRLPDHMRHDIDGMLGAGLPASMNTTKTQIDMWHFNVPKFKEFLTFSVNDRYQLNSNAICLYLWI